MTKTDDFFGSPDWTESTRQQFDAKIRRIPKGHSRARRFEDKAHSLFYKGADDEHKLAAVALLERGLLEAECDDRHKAELCETLAGYQLKLGQRAAATATLRRCIALAPLGSA